MSQQSFGNTIQHTVQRGDNTTALHSVNSAHIRGLAQTDRRPALTHSRALTQVSHRTRAHDCLETTASLVSHPRLLKCRQVGSQTQPKTAKKRVGCGEQFQQAVDQVEAAPGTVGAGIRGPALDGAKRSCTTHAGTQETPPTH